MFKFIFSTTCTLTLFLSGSLHAWQVPDCGYVPSPVPSNKLVSIIALYAAGDEYGELVSSGCESTSNLLSQTCEMVTVDPNSIDQDLRSEESKINASSILLFVGFRPESRRNIVGTVKEINEKMPVLFVESNFDHDREIKIEDGGMTVLKIGDVVRHVDDMTDEKVKMRQFITGVTLSNAANEIRRGKFQSYDEFASSWVSGL